MTIFAFESDEIESEHSIDDEIEINLNNDSGNFWSRGYPWYTEVLAAKSWLDNNGITSYKFFVRMKFSGCSSWDYFGNDTYCVDRYFILSIEDDAAATLFRLSNDDVTIMSS